MCPLFRRVIALAIIMAGSLFYFSSTFAFDHPAHGELPNIDKRRAEQRQSKPVPPGRAEATEKLKQRVDGLKVERDALLQTPKYIGSTSGFLSGPDGQGKGISPQRVQAWRADDPHRSIKAFLNEHAAVFGHGAEVVQAQKPQREFVSRHNGLRTVVWEQRVDDIPVYEAVLVGHISARGELVSLSSQFIPEAGRAADAGTPNRAAAIRGPLVSASRAVWLAAESIEEPLLPGEIAALDAAPAGAQRTQRFKAGGLPGEAQVQLVWLPLDGSTLRLCWDVAVTRHVGNERYRVLIDAQTEELHVRQRLTVYLTDASYRVFAGDSPTPFSPGWPTPNTNQPPAAARALVTLAALNTNASPIGWISDGENETRGNNVDGHHDWNADDLPDLPRPQGSPFRVFDPPLDFTLFAFDYGEAAVVSLFYWCNWMHDRLYELGFDEAAGNFQKDNFGRGGYGNDPIMADAQDGSGINNANFTPAPDGVPGRVQMFIFTGPEPDRDGDFDAEVILHECTHGLSTRLVGGGVGISALQSAGMGEGWSDFYAISLLSGPSDDPDGVYAFGAYAAYLFGGNTQNYYFGIRRFPYSTDLKKNPLTFKDIDPVQIDFHVGVPANPANGINPLFANEVHAQGELWCATLWDARANLIRKHGYASGNQLILQLVTDGMKLSPPNPNFLQARDAIILADQVNNAGENYSELWSAFAKRGMGFSARSPDSSTTTGVLEAFDLPDALFIINPENVVASGPQAGPFAPVCRTYPLTNISSQPISWSVRVTQPWLAVSPTSGVLAPLSVTNISVCLTTNAAALPLGSFVDTILFLNDTTKIVQTRRANLRVLAFASMPFIEDFESGSLRPVWSVTGTGTHRTEITTLNGPHAGTHHLTFDALGGINSRNELTLGLDLGGYTNVVLRFWAKNIADEPDGPPPVPFIDEADFDGVAISDDGVHWYEVQSLRFLSPEYQELVVDLDDFVARYGLHYNSTFQIRFNQFDNFSIPFDGLALDDISVTGIAARRLVVSVPAEANEGAGVLEGMVVLGAPVTANLNVALRSSEPAKVTVPSTVVIPAGSDHATFALTILDDGALDGTVPATISASASGYFGQSATIAIHDNETAGLRVMLPRRAREGDGMMLKMGTVRINPKPARDVAIGLRSSDSEKVSVPPAVIIPAGQGSATFDLFVGNDGRIDGSRVVTITAHVDNWSDGHDTILVLDNDAPALSVVLPAALGESNGTVTNAGRVRLSGTLLTNLVVTLTSSDTTELLVPRFVQVPAGEIEFPFNVTVVADARADGPQTVTVTARASNFAEGSGRTVILDAETPPRPYAPDPPDAATNAPIKLALSWKPGVGEVISEGGFETGTFAKWVTRDTGFGSWVINDGTLDPDGPEGPTNAFAGKFNAVTVQIGAGEHLLYQDVFIPLDAQSATLTWAQRIRNHAAYFSVPNQRFRVEIRTPADELLAVAFETAPGDTLLQDWQEHHFDVSPFRGQTIRVAFHQQDNLGYFNVHIDNVSVKLGEPETGTLFDVYFGTTSTLGSANKLGSTTNAAWVLPALSLNTKYYWQIVSRRGAIVTQSPVWQFTTRGIGSVHHFEWSHIASPEQVNQRFAVALAAKDDINNTVKNFTGPVTVTVALGSGTASRVVITEIDVAANDRVEFMNVSTAPVDLSGWQISIFDAVSWPAPLDTFIVPTGSVCPARAVFQLNELGSRPGAFPNLYSGTNVMWNNAMVGNPIAVLLRDAAGEIVDFVAAGTADPSLITMPLRIPRELWTGLPVSAATTNAALTLQRQGNIDHNDSSDWVIGLNTFGTRNAGLSLPFSERTPISITPTILTNFVTGIWTGFLTVQDVSPRMTLRADDGAGHVGFANEFSVGALNDISVSGIASPDVTLIGGPLIYSLVVSNSGPLRATGVTLTNVLPPEVTFVSAATFNGICTNSGQRVICNLGRLSEGDSAVVTITTRALGAGSVTNRAWVNRAEADAYVMNNSAVIASTVVLPLVYSTNVNIVEGDSGMRNVNFPVRLTAPCTLPVSIDYTTSNLTAVAGADYVATSGTLVFEPGVTNLTVSVPIIGDVIDEANEQFLLLLFSPTNAIAGPTVRCRINDDDPLPAISINDVTVTEGSEATTNYAVFTVSAVGASDIPLFVNYSTADRTATSSKDYGFVFGTLVFPVGTSNMTIAVPIHGDRQFEPSETFELNLSAAVNATISRAQGIATILDDDATELDHFEWSPMAALQFVDVPFVASLTAKDGLDRVAANFNGPVEITGISDRRQIVVGSGTNGWDRPMGTLFHDGRTQVIYLPEELGGPGRVNALALQIQAAPGQILTNWTIRMKHSSRRSYPPALWETNGWTVVYRRNEGVSATGWATFLFDTPFAYNGTDPLMIDLSFNNSTYSFDGLCASTETAERRAISFATDSAFGDPLAWNGSSPPPQGTNRVPNIRLSMEQPVLMTPTGNVPIVNGRWSGRIQIHQQGTNVFLRVSDGNGHIAEGNEFSVDSSVDADHDGLPDAWERRYFGSTGHSGQEDTDGDGLSNLQEFRAGTDPTDASSTVRITGVQYNESGIVVAFSTVAGKAYRLERSVDVSGPAWNSIGEEIQGTGSVVQIRDVPTRGGANCFYRVRLVP
jgi:uncharacterized repeat protein (TIGR01451 family)